MKRLVLNLATLTVVVFSNCVAADSTDVIAVGPIRTVTAESGVVPPGTSVLVRTMDAVKTNKAYRGTVYFATVATDIVDENGTVLIPSESPIELVARSISYFGPGGVGMTLLTLDIDAVVVRDVRYPVETDNERPNAGGIGIDRGGAKWIGGGEEAAHHVVTRGHNLNVPAGILLAFTIQAPIRLQGFRR
jgi:hypothetical protein